MPPYKYLPPEKTADNKEIRGFTWRQAGAFLCAFAILEFTLVGGLLDIKSALKDHGKAIEVLQGRVDNIVVDADLLKRHMDVAETNISNLQKLVYPQDHTVIPKAVYEK